MLHLTKKRASRPATHTSPPPPPPSRRTLQSTNILPEASKDNAVINYWMPVVLFNARTATYIMQYWSSRCGFKLPCADVATSTSPYGPFTMVPPIQLHGGTPSSQMGFFADSDGNAYVKYNTVGPSQHHAVELLTDDWLSSTGSWAVLFWKPSFAWMEGGGMFRRGGKRFPFVLGSTCH